jgi:hypothetical protein
MWSVNKVSTALIWPIFSLAAAQSAFADPVGPQPTVSPGGSLNVGGVVILVLAVAVSAVVIRIMKRRDGDRK